MRRRRSTNPLPRVPRLPRMPRVPKGAGTVLRLGAFAALGLAIYERVLHPLPPTGHVVPSDVLNTSGASQTYGGRPAPPLPSWVYGLDEPVRTSAIYCQSVNWQGHGCEALQSWVNRPAGLPPTIYGV